MVHKIEIDIRRFIILSRVDVTGAARTGITADAQGITATERGGRAPAVKRKDNTWKS